VGQPVQIKHYSFEDARVEALRLKLFLKSEEGGFLSILGIASEASKRGLFLGPKESLPAPNDRIRMFFRPILFMSEDCVLETTLVDIEMFEFVTRSE